MKTFFKDYIELTKKSWGFLTKHWFGTLVLTVICGIVSAELALIQMLGWNGFTKLVKGFFTKKEEADEELDEELKLILGE